MLPETSEKRAVTLTKARLGGITSVRAGAWCPARRSGFLRHTARSTEGCCRQALTRFAAPRCAGPDRRARHQALLLPGPSVRGLFRLACLDAGGVRERPNRHDWKSCVGKLTVGSNPTLSASLRRSEVVWWAAVRGVWVPSDGFDRQTDRQVDRQLSRQHCHPGPFGHFAKRGPWRPPRRALAPAKQAYRFPL